MANHLVLDIETIPDPELPRTDDSEKVPPPPFNQIVTLGCLLLEDYVPKKRLNCVGEHEDRRARCSPTSRQWLDQKRPTIVTWNGRGFDMPVITSRALRHGISMPWWFTDRATRYRYSTEGYFDLMELPRRLRRHEERAPRRLRERLVGFPRQGGRRRLAGRPAGAAPASSTEVNAYCLCDVAQTAAIFLRVEHLRGTLDKPTFRDRAAALLAYLDEQPRVKPMRT